MHLLIVCLLAASASDANSTLITVGSGVRVRREAQTGRVVDRLSVGTVLHVIERSAQQDSVDGLTAFWYRVSYDNGECGWIFGGQTLPYAEQNKAAVYQQIARQRLEGLKQTFSEPVADPHNSALFQQAVDKYLGGKKQALAEWINLYDFIRRAISEIGLPTRDIAGELSLDSLLILSKIAKLAGDLETMCCRSKCQKLYRFGLPATKENCSTIAVTPVFSFHPNTAGRLKPSFTIRQAPTPSRGLRRLKVSAANARGPMHAHCKLQIARRANI